VAKVLSRLKSIEKMMRPLVPLKDQVTMLETTIIELGQQQLMNADLLRVKHDMHA
jgi:hypothetical protein